MARPRIAIYTMAKNEAEHVPRFAKVTQEADVVVVTDTGSTDGTPDLLRDHNITVHTSRIIPWRFDLGTNCALCHVPEDIDICIKLDLDEVIHSRDGSSWREEIEKLWQQSDTQQIRYWYTWSWHVSGKVPAVRFRTANIHARAGFLWRHAGHSILTASHPGKVAEAENFEIHHYMQEKHRPDYLPLLETAVRENECPRTLFYLGREYHLRKRDRECISILSKYLRHAQSKWPAERANAFRLIGLSWDRCGEKEKALGYLLQACTEYPAVRDIWWELLNHFHRYTDLAGAYWAGTKCLAITTRDPQWVANTADAWSDKPYLRVAQCCWATKRLAEARQIAAAGIEKFPDSFQLTAFISTTGDKK